jgi:hypothetical protein
VPNLILRFHLKVAGCVLVAIAFFEIDKGPSPRGRRSNPGDLVLL